MANLIETPHIQACSDAAKAAAKVACDEGIEFMISLECSTPEERKPFLDEVKQKNPFFAGLLTAALRTSDHEMRLTTAIYECMERLENEAETYPEFDNEEEEVTED